MSEWCYLLQACRPTLMQDATGEEQASVRRHFRRLVDMLEAGTLVLAGPCTDGVGPGIVVFEAADEDEARRVMEEDPAVVDGVMTATLHPYRVSLLRGRPVD